MDNLHGCVPNSPYGIELRDRMLFVLSSLGVPLNAKDSFFGTRIQHLGFIFDSETLTVEIPLDRCNLIVAALHDILGDNDQRV